MSSPKIWFITGASRGFGLSMTRFLLQNGDIAIATMRDPSAASALTEQYGPEKLLVIKLDVTKRDDITAAFAKAKEVFGRIDVVFNNAGYSLLGELESTPDELARPLFEVDFWGPVHVTQEAVKFLREVNPGNSGGRIIQNSSCFGFAVIPGMALYGAAKAALEAVSENLAAELDPAWNIKISILELGGFHTGVESSFVYAPAHPAYTNPNLMFNQIRGAFQSGQFVTTGDPDKGAKILYRVSQLSEPPMRIPLGKDCLGVWKAKLESLKKDLDMCESWSDGIEI